MKIEKFIKLNSNKYKIIFDDETIIKLYDDVIVKYNLIVNKEMDDNKFDEIVEYNDNLDAYYKSLKYINKKLRTEKEIYKYLEKDFDKKIIFDTIDKLKGMGYLNKELYLKAYINDHINLHDDGPNKMKDELIKLGFNEEEFRDSINNISDDIWLSKLDRLVKRKIKQNHNYGVYKLKEKILYDLSNQGYYKWMIEDVINKQEFDDTSNIMDKEFNKLYNKLSSKYEGNELFYQIKAKLVNKGFSYYEVDDFINKKKDF